MLFGRPSYPDFKVRKESLQCQILQNTYFYSHNYSDCFNFLGLLIKI